MSSPPATSALPSDLEGLRRLKSQLSDDLALQRTIFESLKDVTPDQDVGAQLNDAKTEIRNLQKRLSEARKAQYQIEKTGKPKLATQPVRQRLDQVDSRDFAGDSWSTSSASKSLNMYDRKPASGPLGDDGPSRPATPSRKRTYSHANVTPAKPGVNKSRRSNGSQPASFDSSPSTAVGSDRDDVSVIDLTGDDEDMYRQLDEQIQRYRRHKEVADSDATMARRLQDEGLAVVHSSSTPNQPGSSTPSYLDRLIPSRSSQTPASQPTQSVRGTQARPPYTGNVMDIPERPSPRSVHSVNRSFSSAASLNTPLDAPRMPGAYVDSDEDKEDEYGTLLGARTSAVGPSSSRVASASSLSGIGRSFAIAQAERQAALERGRNSPASLAARQAALSRVGNGYSHQPSPTHQSDFSHGLPSSSLSSWQAELESQGFAAYYPHSSYINPSQRPGYVSGGVGNPLVLQSSRAAPGMSVYGNPPLGPGAGLSSVINRTNGYDYTAMTDAAGNPLNERLTSYIHDVMDDPRKTAEEIQNLLSNIRPDMEIPAEERGETPEALKYSLYTHQQVALRWMSGMEEGTNKGGILADDMGLGKTISTLSLMVTRKSTTPTKTNLIVGPVALIKQWESEIRKKLKPEHRLSVILFHQKKLQYSDMKTFDVVLTTYGKVASEYKRYIKHLEARQDSANYEAYDDLELQRTCPLLHPRSKFYRVILDEAQCIKNRLGQASLGCNQLSAEYRWCLTGTPMMNGVTELYPLIRFLKIRPYNELKRFTEHFKGLTAKRYTSEVEKERSMQQLRIVLKAIMLRRMKDSKIDGEPILVLPPKTEVVQNCVFSDEEQKFYKELESKSQVTFNKYLRAGTIGKNYSHVLVLLLRLRQACCHPHLNMDVEYAGVNNDVSVETMEDFAKRLSDAVVARIKAAEGFDCPICFDAVPDPTIFFPCGHDTCAECFTSLTENALQANIRSGQEGDAAAKCPECRVAVRPKEVFNYTTFKKVHMPESITAVSDKKNALDREGTDDTESDESDEETASEASDDEADEHGDLRDFIVPDDQDDDSEADSDDGGDDDEFTPGKASTKAKKGGKLKKKSRRSQKGKKGKGKSEDVKPHMLKTLRLEASKNQEARRRYMRYLKKNWEPSAKTTKVCELLKEIEPSGEKTIIFSQWTAMLDLLEIPIKYELGIKYCRYDGGMSRAEREDAIAQFVENPRVKVMLVSLRAGNAGLNLTAASHVIICDPFWNPFIEMQAVDRAHRIGQQLPVQVHRVLVKGSGAEGSQGGKGGDGAANALEETVEDRIVTLQDKKRGLINAALDEGESRSLGRLSERELRYLFGVSERPR